MQVPIAAVAIVDESRLWFKSEQGLGCSSADRHSAFCAWTLLPKYPEMLVIEDTQLDARLTRTLWSMHLLGGERHGCRAVLPGGSPACCLVGTLRSCPGRNLLNQADGCSWKHGKAVRSLLLTPDALPCRFSGNPVVVHPPYLRFYAGAPLVTSLGHRLGTL